MCVFVSVYVRECVGKWILICVCVSVYVRECVGKWILVCVCVPETESDIHRIVVPWPGSSGLLVNSHAGAGET